MAYRETSELEQENWRKSGAPIMQAGWLAQGAWAIGVFLLNANHGGLLVQVLVNAALVLGTLAMLLGARRFVRFYRLRPVYMWLGLFSLVGMLMLYLLSRSVDIYEEPSGFEVRMHERESVIWRMAVKVRLAGDFARHVQGEDIVLEMPKGAPVSVAVRMVGRVFPHLTEELFKASYWVKGEAVKFQDSLEPETILEIRPANMVSEADHAANA